MIQQSFIWERADVFYRKLNTRRPSVGLVSIPIPAGLAVDAFPGLVALLALASQACGVALNQRQGKLGVFEVQTDAGIWDAADAGALITYDRRAEKMRQRPATRFRTWEQIEAEERSAA